MEHLPYQPNIGNLADEAVLLESRYEPIRDNDFRLVRLEGYDERGILRCELRHECLTTASYEPYCAISCTWKEERVWYGKYDFKIPQPIWIGDALVLISNKVANILSTMFQKSRKTLWIDSICINQLDAVDKSKQVCHMGSIYSSAKEVMSVLGSPNSNTDAALEPGNWFSTELYKTQSRYESLRTGLLQITVDDYWTRSWVLQEITMARTASVCCGSHAVAFAIAKEFGDVARARPSISSLRSLCSRLYFVNMFQGHKLLAKALARNGMQGIPFDIGSAKTFLDLDFLTLLETSRRFKESQDPRDFIYSRLSLATDAATLVTSPDYSLSVEDVYCRFAASCITTTRNLEVLRHTRPSDMNLPSWVPNWTSRSLDYQWSAAFERDNATEIMSFLSWDGPYLPSIDHEKWELSVRGRVLTQLPEANNDVSGQATLSPRRLRRGLEQGVRRSYELWMQAALSHMPGMDPNMFRHSDDAMPGDLVCVLQEYSGFVCLRGIDDHYVLVGRMSQPRILKLIDFLVWTYPIGEGQYPKQKWRFRSPEDVSAIEQKWFRIR